MCVHRGTLYGTEQFSDNLSFFVDFKQPLLSANLNARVLCTEPSHKKLSNAQNFKGSNGFIGLTMFS